MKKNKKGVSALIAIVMVVLITLAAVGIVWQVVIPLIRTGMETSKLCSNVQLTIDIESGYTFCNTTHISVMVSAAMIAGGEIEFRELDGVQIKVLYDGKSETFDTRTDLGPEAASKPVPGINEEWTYVIDKTLITGIPNGVAIAPILQVGGKDFVCQMTPKATLEGC